MSGIGEVELLEGIEAVVLVAETDKSKEKTNDEKVNEEKEENETRERWKED